MDKFIEYCKKGELELAKELHCLNKINISKKEIVSNTLPSPLN